MRALTVREIHSYIVEHFPNLKILTPKALLSARNGDYIDLYCPKHDYTFKKTFNKMKHANQGCKYCGRENIGNKLRKPLKQIKKDLKELYNNNLPYEILSTEQEYQENYPNLKLKCKSCNKIFYNTQIVLLQGVICADCGHKRGAEKQRFTLEQVRQKLKDLGWKLLSKHYETNQTPLQAQCLECGAIYVKTYNKFQSRGCKNCADIALIGQERLDISQSLKQLTIKTIKERVAEVSSDIEIISKEYLLKSEGGDAKVACKCRNCGREWRAEPSNLFQGQGCRVCRNKQGRDKVRWHYNEVQTYLKENKRNIKLLTLHLKNMRTLVKLKCLNCNNIWQARLTNVIHHNSGCPRCCLVQSTPELEIQDIFSDFKIITNSRKIIAPYEVDIYIPKLKLAIEFNGTYWHSIYFKDKDYHITKTLLAKQKGIKLIHIFDDEWAENKEQVVSYLKDIIKFGEPLPELGQETYPFSKYPQLTPLMNPKIVGEGKLAYYDCGDAK